MKLEIKYSLTLAMGVAFLLVGCSDAVSRQQEEFIAGCESEGASEEVCECAYEKISTHYGKEKFAEWGEKGWLPLDYAEIAVPASLECAQAPQPAQILDLSGRKSPPSSEPPVSAVPPQQSDAAIVNQALRQVETRDGVDEDLERRLASSGDLNADGQDDMVVAASFEKASENTSSRELFVFLRRNGHLALATHQGVGGVVDMTVIDGELMVTTLEHADDDARCCPSKEVLRRYAVVNGALRELAPQ